MRSELHGQLADWRAACTLSAHQYLIPKLGVRLRLLNEGTATVMDETVRIGMLADHTLQGDGGDCVPFGVFLLHRAHDVSSAGGNHEPTILMVF